MNNNQRQIVRLMAEIDEICVANGIPYLISGRAAKDACLEHDFIGDYLYATVLMTGSGLKKFRSIVESMPDRTLESIRDNPDFPDLAVRYVDESTTFLYGDSAHKYKCKGFYVTIQKCSAIPKNKRKSKLANEINNVLAYSCFGNTHGLSKVKRFIIRFVKLLMKIFGKGRIIRLLLHFHDRLTAKDTGSYAYIRAFKKNVVIPKSMFFSVQRVALGDHSFFIPTETDKYMGLVYGKSWDTDTEPAMSSAAHLLVASDKVSYRELEESISFAEDHARAIDSSRKKRARLQDTIAGYSAKIEHYWDYLFATKERFDLFRQFAPIKDILAERFEARDKDYLVAAMEPYLSSVKEYAARKVPVEVVPELDRIAENLLFYMGEYDAAREYSSMLKKAKMKPVSLAVTDEMRDAAIAALPKKLGCEPDGSIPLGLTGDDGRAMPAVRISGSGAALPLVRMTDAPERSVVALPRTDGSGRLCPVMCMASDGSYIPAVSGDAPVTLYYTDFCGRRFPVASLSPDGSVYVSVSLDENGFVVEREPDMLLSVAPDLSVPVSVRNGHGSLSEVFCRDGSGARHSAVKLGLGGVLAVAELGRNMKLCCADADGSEREFAVSEDAEESDVFEQFIRSPVRSWLVQADPFGRELKVAALTGSGVLIPTCYVDADGRAVFVSPEDAYAPTLCIDQGDGNIVPLARIRYDGNVVPIGGNPSGSLSLSHQKF